MKKRENERFSTLVLSWISKLTFTSNVPPAVSQGSAIRKSLKRQEVLTSYAMGASPAPAWCFEHSSPPASATSIVVVLFAVVSLSLSQTTFFFGLPCLLKKISIFHLTSSFSDICPHVSVYIVKSNLSLFVPLVISLFKTTTIQTTKITATL